MLRLVLTSAVSALTRTYIIEPRPTTLLRTQPSDSFVGMTCGEVYHLQSRWRLSPYGLQGIWNSRIGTCTIRAAGSDGRRNTCLQSTRWSLES